MRSERFYGCLGLIVIILGTVLAQTVSAVTQDQLYGPQLRFDIYRKASKVGEHGNTETWGGGDDYYMSEVDFGNRDDEHDTLLVRSPVFVLSGADGDLSMRTYGGVDGDNLPSSVGDLASSTTAADGVHALGMGLREVGTNNYLLTAASGGHNDPLIISFPQAQLAPLAGKAVTVDVFDSTSNGWGWVVFDDVVVPTVIPEPMTLSLLGLGGGLAMLRRRKQIA